MKSYLVSAMASRSPSVVWVDFSFIGDEIGTQANPYNTFAEAKNAVADMGTINVLTGSTNETPILDKPLTVVAVGGPVTAGDPNAPQPSGLRGSVIAAFDSSRSFPGLTLLGTEFQTLVQNLSAAGASIIEISTLDQASLDGVDIFFTGVLNAADLVTAAEQNTLLAFVEAGGGLIAFTERNGFANNNDPITSPFGVTGVGSEPEDLTTITQLAHPVMNGRFGVVDNAGNVYDPERPGGFNPSPAQVLATNDDGEGAILALEKELGKAVFFNDISFISDNFLFDGAGNLPAIMNAFDFVSNPEKGVGETSVWLQPFVWSVPIGYKGDEFDHQILDPGIVVGDTVRELITYLADDMGGLGMTEITRFQNQQFSNDWLIESATKHGTQGLWRNDTDAHAIAPDEYETIVDYFQSTDAIGTILYKQEMTHLASGKVYATHFLTMKVIKIAEDDPCGYFDSFVAQHLIEKSGAHNPDAWPFLPDIPCAPE